MARSASEKLHLVDVQKTLRTTPNPLQPDLKTTQYHPTRVKDSFLGDDWVSPLLEDSLRFKATGKLHPLDLEREHGEMAWIEPDQVEYGYPALHELVVNLHALAFELNLKEPGLRLSRPFQGEIAVAFSELKQHNNRPACLSARSLFFCFVCVSVQLLRDDGDQPPWYAEFAIDSVAPDEKTGERDKQGRIARALANRTDSMYSTRLSVKSSQGWLMVGSPTKPCDCAQGSTYDTRAVFLHLCYIDWLADTPPLPTGSTMLLRLTERCRVPVRLDSVAGGAQTGHKISAVYFVGRCCTITGATGDKTSKGRVYQEYDVSAASGAAAGGQLRLQNIEAAAPLAEGLGDSHSSNIGSGSPPAAASTEGGESNDSGHKSGNSSSASEKASLKKGSARQAVVLEPTADRLVVFRSGSVSTETLEVMGRGQEQYAVLFWMHGAKEGVGEATG